MQRASGLGAWIMAGLPARPNAEKTAFLVLFVFYADARVPPAGQAGEISGFLPSFVGYARQPEALVLRAFTSVPDNKEILPWQYPE
ncbi:hypothetical protein [Achromobacter aloeverae]|uniref:hypothetical protein n=1 Tax=Achromobacter aloeverae TaxID=1750518 RepID=UPI00100EEE4A|nr:hypothetical protein [Achromobacter aloeverae]